MNTSGKRIKTFNYDFGYTMAVVAIDNEINKFIDNNAREVIDMKYSTAQYYLFITVIYIPLPPPSKTTHRSADEPPASADLKTKNP